MKKINEETELKTSEQARDHGLKRIERRHVMQPGQAKLSDAKVRVTMYLDGDVLEYFKERAAQPNAAPYQTQINNELRAVMEGKQDDPYASLVNDQQFIAAVAERVRNIGR